MAFTISDKVETVFGNKRAVYGVYTNDSGSTGGDIDAGLTTYEVVQLQPKGSSVSANQPVVNETLPLTGSDPTIVTGANEVGTFFVLGE